MSAGGADRGLLAALAIAFTQAGITDRPSRLAAASLFVDRPITSTAELTPEETRGLRRYLRRHPEDAMGRLLRTADERRQAAEPEQAGR